MLDPKTTFTDEEIREILRRATDRQEKAERARVAGPGGELSLASLEEIAGTVGITPAHLQAAAQEIVLSRGARPAKRTLGVPETIAHHRVLPGGVDDPQWARMVGHFREAFGRNGVVSQFGAVREWTSSSGSEESSPITVRLEPHAEGTIATIHQSLRAYAQGPIVLGGSFIAVALVILILFLVGDFESSSYIASALFGGLGVTCLGGGAVVVRAWSERQREKLRGVLDRVELIQRGG